MINPNLYFSENDLANCNSRFYSQSKENFKIFLRKVDREYFNRPFENIFELINFESSTTSLFGAEKASIENRAVIQLLETGVNNEWFNSEDLHLINAIALQAKIRDFSASESPKTIHLISQATRKINQEILLSNLARSVEKGDIKQIRTLLPLIDNDKMDRLPSLIKISELEKVGYSPLFKKEILEDASMVHWLLNLGFRADARNTIQATPLHLAAYYGLDSIMEILINHQIKALQNNRAHLSLLTIQEMINAFDDAGTAPLHSALEGSRYSSAQFLLNNGADINISTKKGITPLHMMSWKKDNPNFLTFLFSFPKINPNLPDSEGYTPLIVALVYENYETVKFLLNSKKVDVLKADKNQHSPFMILKQRKGPYYNELKKMLIDRDPLTKKISHEIISRKFLAHVSETGGKSTLHLSHPEQYSEEIDLSGFLLELIWPKIFKATQALKSIDPHLKSLLSETAQLAANPKVCPKTILKRWEEGLPVYLNVGSMRHHMGMLLFRNELVFSNRWEKSIKGQSSYVAYRFDPSLLNEAILEKMINRTDEAKNKLTFLNDQLPTLLNSTKDIFHERFEKIPVFAQKDDIGNCVWLNTQGLELPLCVLYKKYKLIEKKRLITVEDFEKICDEQKNLWENLLSNHQHYPLTKALKKVSKNSLFVPDFELLSRVFCACYPYSKEDMLPEIVEKWTETEKLFLKVMPKIYKERFKKIKIAEELVQSQIQRSKQFLKESEIQKSAKENLNPLHQVNFNQLSLYSPSHPPSTQLPIKTVSKLPPLAVPNLQFFGRDLIANIYPVSHNNRDPLHLFPPSRRQSIVKYS